jgi:hypothetical protein
MTNENSPGSALEAISATQGSGLTRKLCEVAKTLTWVKKRGRVDITESRGYNYATEADLVLAIRMELFKRNIFLYPLTISTSRAVVPGKTYNNKDGSSSTSSKYLTDTVMQWTWVDGDTGEERVCGMPGCGEDAGDKGTSKSITMSEKYLLLKSFLIPTFDDEAQMSPDDKKALQERVKTEKLASMKATVAARGAQSEEEAKREIAKGKVVFITMPDRFNGEFAAVFGTGIQEAGMENFFADCDAQRFKAPEGIIRKLSAQYVNDCKALVTKLGMTLEVKE